MSHFTAHARTVRGLRTPTRRTGLIGLASMAALGVGGCAKTPAGLSVSANNQLIVSFTVLGQIDLTKHYFFAIDTTGDPSQGPVPVVSRPWGNGWGAGNISYYVQMDNAQPGPSDLGLYTFASDPDPANRLLKPIFLGRPLADPFQPTSTVRFSLDLSQLTTPTGAPVTDIKVNFIATDRIPTNPQDPSGKLVDALGPTGNNYAILNVQSNRIFRNADSTEPEDRGDVPDPSIDLVDWQIEVRRS